MANPRKPHSSQSPSGADPDAPTAHSAEDEISLEESDGHHASRVPLPVQRKEKKQFEMAGAPAAAPKERVHPPAANTAASQDWEPVPADEIESYDPSARDGTVARPAPGESNKMAEVKVTVPATVGLDDLDEFIARTVASGPMDKEPKVRRPFTLLEKICTGSGLTLLLVLMVWLFRAAATEDNSVPPVSTAEPDLPMKGELLTIKEAVANWRKRTDTDRTAQMEAILPVPGLQMPEYLPQVVFTVESSGSGYLRFIYMDSFGKSRGDTRVIQVTNGQIVKQDKGEIITGAGSGSVYCSEGMLSYHDWQVYGSANLPRWHVQVAESNSYSAPDKDWKVLGTFDIQDEIAP